jgi:hypothetical protein
VQKLNVPDDNTVIQSELFPENSRKIISMISMILGENDDLIVDEFGLGIMASICPIMTKPITKFNFPQFLADQIHYQLSELNPFEASDISHIWFTSSCLHKLPIFCI